MKLAWTSLVLLCLFSCSSGGGLSAQDKTYYQEMQSASQPLKALQSMAQSSSFAKVRYQMAVNEMLPTTQSTLKKYKAAYGTRDSYQSLFKSFESYLIAERRWAEEKGLNLVNQRLGEGSKWLDQFQHDVEAEMNPVEEAK